MTAHDAMNPAQFFHGTARELGDTVEPGHKRAVDAGKDMSHLHGPSTEVFYTTDRDWAKRMAVAAESHEGTNIARVYAVQPTGPASLDDLDSRGFSFKSPHPLKVLGEVTSRKMRGGEPAERMWH
jgi:hypothetical protein